MISVPQVGTQEPQKNFHGEWEVCTPETARRFSAVGYLFGRQLHQTLGVPIGLIDDSWGGSACESWIRRDVLEKDEKYKPLLDRWAAIEKSDAPQDKGQLGGNQRPANIYNGVLKPTIGYGIKGVIWYQGESNAGRAYQYRDLFPLMIQSCATSGISAISPSIGSNSPTSSRNVPNPAKAPGPNCERRRH